MAQDFTSLGAWPSAPLAVPEDELWSLVKDEHSARAVLKTMPHGLELRIDLDGSLLWLQLFHDDGDPVAAAREHRQAFVDRGWTAPE